VTYAPPTITSELGRPEAATIRNSFGQKYNVPVCEQIQKVGVEDLVQNFGSPLFVFSERAILNTARRARKAFKSVYPDTTFAWSYKTNYLKAVCNLFHNEGWLAEVVSDFEYQKAKHAGVRDADIIYNGPCKTRGSLEYAMRQGALVQIDNWEELRVVGEIASIMQRSVNVGMRAWIDTGLTPVWSKFGFALANGEAGRAALQITDNPYLKLHTLHTHIGTWILNPRAYGVAAERLLALRELVHNSTGHLIPCINLGGGFPSASALSGIDQPSRPIEDYAAAIAGVLNKLPRRQRPQLRLETGRHLIDDAGWLITTIAAVKSGNHTNTLGDGRGSYTVDAGVHLVNLAAWFKIGVTPARVIPLPTKTVKLYGCLCMNIDVIRDAVELPPLDVGDRLVLHPVGAYNLTQSMQFIALRPAVVLIGADGAVHVIRRREVLADLESTEQVPEHLNLRRK
jgi:diaminopimelate decarboxylase